MIFYVYLALLICYLPNTILHTIYSLGIDSPPIFHVVCDIIFVLNSSLNPLIYCWRMKHIRLAAKAILGFLRSQLEEDFLEALYKRKNVFLGRAD